MAKQKRVARTRQKDQLAAAVAFGLAVDDAGWRLGIHSHGSKKLLGSRPLDCPWDVRSATCRDLGAAPNCSRCLRRIATS